MKLNYLIRIFSISFATILIISPVNADFQDGWNAYTNQDFKTAAKEWKPLAEKGDSQSQSNLGILYFNGKGVLKDYKKAVSWLKRAADQGEAEAQFILGKIYIDGDGVVKSFKTAKYWVQLAYENNFEGSQELWNKHELWKY